MNNNNNKKGSCTVLDSLGGFWFGFFFFLVSTASHSNSPVDLNQFNMIWMNTRQQRNEVHFKDLF